MAPWGAVVPKSNKQGVEPERYSRLIEFKFGTKLRHLNGILFIDLFKLINIRCINPLNAELNPICHPLALLETHHILHVSRISVNCR